MNEYMMTDFPDGTVKLVVTTDLGHLPVNIGKNTMINPTVVFGEPQHREYYKKPNHKFKIIIGDNTVIREFCAIHRGTERDTVIGNNVFIMGLCHVSHDAIIGDFVTLTNACQLGGFTNLMHHCNLGFGSVTHQYTVVGPYAMVGMGSIVTKHVPPFTLFYDGRIRGLNEVGMKRAGFSETAIEKLRQYYYDRISGRKESVSWSRLSTKIKLIFGEYVDAKKLHSRTFDREESKWEWEEYSMHLMASADMSHED
jgi:UDP-N-acetylglucosamine acyltransferase